MKNTINLFFSSDQNYYPGLAVSVLSCLNSSSGKYNYTINILGGNISRENKKELEIHVHKISLRKKKKLIITWLEHNTSEIAALPDCRASHTTYTKFLIPFLLPNLSEIIHVDSDTLSNKGVEAFAELPKQKQTLLVGTLDHIGTLKNDCPAKLLNNKNKESPYINAGIMWLNLKLLREMNFTQKALDFCCNYPNVKQADQSAFNYLCANRIKTIEEENNFCLSLGTGQTVIEKGDLMNLHFIGQNKPWLTQPLTKQYAAYRKWWEFAQKFNLQDLKNSVIAPFPIDFNKAKLKSMLNLLNSNRRALYLNDLNSTQKPEPPLK